jgi:hypothetical protein
MNTVHASIDIEVDTDPVEIAKSQARRAKFERNLAWFQDHALEIGNTCRGKCICIAGQELFVADTPLEALRLARTAHPEDEGFFLHYIHKVRAPRIYAHPRYLAGV